MQFAISTHLFHGARLTRRHLETVAAHGFDAIEVFATRTHFDYRDANQIDELRQWLAELGLQALSMHAPICASFVGGEWGRAFSNASSDSAQRLEAVVETEAAMTAASVLGCGSVVLHLGLPRTQPVPSNDNDPGAVKRSLERLAERSSGAGLRLALEVIPNPLSTPAALVDWLEGELDLNRSGVCLDFGHAHMLDGAAEAVETLSGHVITTHVHDNGGSRDDHLVPFAGTIDWRTTLAALWKTGYGGPLVFEVADHGDAAGVLTRTVGARLRLQAILDDLSEPFNFEQ